MVRPQNGGQEPETVSKVSKLRENSGKQSHSYGMNWVSRVRLNYQSQGEIPNSQSTEADLSMVRSHKPKKVGPEEA